MHLCDEEFSDNGKDQKFREDLLFLFLILTSLDEFFEALEAATASCSIFEAFASCLCKKKESLTLSSTACRVLSPGLAADAFFLFLYLGGKSGKIMLYWEV